MAIWCFYKALVQTPWHGTNHFMDPRNNLILIERANRLTTSIWFGKNIHFADSDATEFIGLREFRQRQIFKWTKKLKLPCSEQLISETRGD
jgi:hypothetical protein